MVLWSYHSKGHTDDCEHLRGTANRDTNHDGKFHRKTSTLETWTSRGSSLSEGLGGSGSVAGSEMARAQTELGVVRNEAAWGSQGQVLHSPGGHIGDFGLAFKCLNWGNEMFRFVF